MSYDPAGGQQPGGQGWQGGQQPYPPPGGGYGQQPAGWGGPPPSGPGGPSGAPAQSNFFAALFDYSFNSFATPGLIRVIYIIGTVLIGLTWLGYTVLGFLSGQAVLGLLALILGAVFALFSIALLRVSLEFYYAVVRMSEDIHNRRTNP